MRKVFIDGKVCVGPHFSKAEFALIRRNLAEKKGLKTLADSLGIAGNLQRLRILYLLHAHKEMCVCDIAEVLELTDSAASQHLRKLKDKHLIESRRERQTIYYSIVPNVFTEKMEDLLVLAELRDQHAFILNERS